MSATDSNYYIIRITGDGVTAVQWSIPLGTRAILRPDPANANPVSIQDGQGGTFTLLAQNVGSGIQDQVILPNGYPNPLLISANAGESLIIW